MTAENYKPAPVFDKLGRDDGAPFYDAVAPAQFPEHRLHYRNQRWAARVGLRGLSDAAWVGHFGRFEPLPDNLTSPLAIRYHGHQFRNYNPDIGDGRGFLFAQLRDDDGRLLDLGTKGSGKTPYSRFGDGRLTLKGAVREILATEMLEALGVYTSKTFSVIETGEHLDRNDEPSPTRAAVLVRLSHSHVRFGAFQRLAFEQDDAAIAELCDYCVEHFYPGLGGASGAARVTALFAQIVQRTARLAAQWMAAGFVHGVLNTDNMNVTAESFDYGPWRFAPTADPSFTAAYFDQSGLYAFGRQAEAAAWNLTRLGGALARIAPVDALNEALERFAPAYEEAMADGFFRRLGLARRGGDDFAFVADFLGWMTQSRAPFEQVFFDWFCGAASADRAAKSPVSELYAGEGFAPLRQRLGAFAPERPERLAAAYFSGETPCTMLIDEVEAIWAPIAENDDWSRLNEKIADIARMRDALGVASSGFAPAIP